MSKKLLKAFFAMLLLIPAIALIQSCSSDNDDSPSSGSIVGVWKNGQTIMTLGKDGSYLSQYTGTFPQTRKGTYSYNSKQKLLVVNVMAVPGENGAYQETLIVQTLTKTTLVLLYTDGDVEGFYTR